MRRSGRVDAQFIQTERQSGMIDRLASLAEGKTNGCLQRRVQNARMQAVQLARVRDAGWQLQLGEYEALAVCVAADPHGFERAMRRPELQACLRERRITLRHVDSRGSG